MKIFSYCIALVLANVLPTTSFCQEVRFVTPTKYTQNEGLTSYSVTKIIKDSYGFLWIGTQEGLNLFDGNHFQTFTKRSPDKHRINGSLVSDLAEDKKRQWMWVLLSYGEVCAIDLLTRTVVRRVSLDTGNPEEVKWKRCLAVKGDTLWIGGHEFITAYDIGQNKILPTEIKQKANIWNHEFNIAMIHFDKWQRMLLLADGYGVVVLDKNYNHLQTFPDSSPFHNNTKLRFWDAVMLNDKLYAGSSRGLQVFDLGSTAVRQEAASDNETLQAEILSITASSDTTLLFSTHHGILEFALSTQKIITYRDVDPDNNLLTTTYDIFYDTGIQQVWLATLSGVASFSPRLKHFKPFTRSGSKVRLQHLFSILPVSQYEIYCGDENGIYYVDTRTNLISRIDSTGSNLMLFRGMSGHVFVSNKNGLQIISDKKLKPAKSLFPELGQLGMDQLSCAIQYNDSLILFGSIIQKGLTVWDTRNRKLRVYQQYSPTHPIDNLTIINYLYKTKSDDVMILTDRSVIAFNPITEKYSTFSIRDTATNEIISNLMDMCEAGDHYYIATYGDGLIETDRQFNVKRIIRTEDGLNNTCVYRLFPYKDNAIIATTNDGLSWITLNPFALKNYFQTDGLHANAFEQLCGFQYHDRILAGGADGFTIIDPAHLPRNARAPELYFKNLKVTTSEGILDTCHLFMKEMIIPTNTMRTTIAFSGLNYGNPKGVTYAYKIEGFNKDWVDLGKQNFVDLIGLAPGTYTFHVRAANEDGIWNTEPLRLDLIYLPKWFQTDIFKVAMLLLSGVFITALWRYRVQQIKKQQEIRREIGNDLHDDIGSALNTLKVFTHLAIRYPENKSHLTQIEESITLATAGLRDMIWVLEDSEDSVFELIERIKKFALPICVANGIQFKTDIQCDNDKVQLLKTEKRNLLLVSKEAINNSIKYSRCKNISVSIMQSGRDLTLRIADDGIGFSTEAVTYGKGLQNIQYRAKQIHFDYEVHATLGKGVVIEMWRRKEKFLFRNN